MFNLINESDAHRIDKNVFEILFTPYYQRDNDNLKQHLEKADALNVYRILQEVNNELVSVKLENVVLHNFLEKNDPKLLIGIDRVRRQTYARASNTGRFGGGSRQFSTQMSPTGSRTESRSMSIAESGTGSVRKGTEYRINYRTKAEMTEKLASDTAKLCEVLESKGMKDIKILTGQIEELRYKINDVNETVSNFELHFIKNNTLENASDKKMESSLRKFINNWLKNGRALLGTMRLKITSLQEQYHQQRATLISKADLSGMLGPVDFEQNQIKREVQTKMLDEKNVSLAGLKEVTGKASLALAKEKKLVIIYEQKSKQLGLKTDDVVKGIIKLEAEAQSVEKEIEIAQEQLKNLKIQVETYEAPKVTDYIKRKGELITLEKEEKLLQRKSYIQAIKLKNITKKLRAQFKEVNATAPVK